MRSLRRELSAAAGPSAAERVWLSFGDQRRDDEAWRLRVEGLHTQLAVLEDAQRREEKRMTDLQAELNATFAQQRALDEELNVEKASQRLLVPEVQRVLAEVEACVEGTLGSTARYAAMQAQKPEPRKPVSSGRDVWLGAKDCVAAKVPGASMSPRPEGPCKGVSRRPLEQVQCQLEDALEDLRALWERWQGFVEDGAGSPREPCEDETQVLESPRLMWREQSLQAEAGRLAAWPRAVPELFSPSSPEAQLLGLASPRKNDSPSKLKASPRSERPAARVATAPDVPEGDDALAAAWRDLVQSLHAQQMLESGELPVRALGADVYQVGDSTYVCYLVDDTLMAKRGQAAALKAEQVLRAAIRTVRQRQDANGDKRMPKRWDGKCVQRCAERFGKARVQTSKAFKPKPRETEERKAVLAGEQALRALLLAGTHPAQQRKGVDTPRLKVQRPAEKRWAPVLNS